MLRTIRWFRPWEFQCLVQVVKRGVVPGKRTISLQVTDSLRSTLIFLASRIRKRSEKNSLHLTL